MDIFLLLYVLGLMVLFFLLGAAIGGAARGMKAHFFGLGENEVFCGESQAARDRALAEKSAIGAAALGGAAVVTDVISDGDVTVANDGLVADSGQDWQPQVMEEAVPIASEGEITRGGDVQDAEITGIEAAQPLGADEMPGDGDFAGAEIFRGVEEPAMEDQPAEEVADFAEAPAHEAMEVAQDPEAEMPPLSETPVDAAGLVDQLPEGVTVASDVESSFEAAMPEAAPEQQPEQQPEPEADTTGFDGGELGAAAAAGLAVAAGALARDDEGRLPRPEAAKPVIWGYTSEADNFNDIEFIASGDDNLQLIRGIDGDTEAALQALGLRQFEQIAALSAREVAFLRTRLGMTSELNQMGWIEQAKILSTGGMTAFAASLGAAVEAPVVDEAPVAAEEAVVEAEAPVEEVVEAVAEADIPVAEDPQFIEAEIAEGEMVDGAPEDFSDISFAATGEDNLLLIQGIDEEMAGRLNGLGIHQFSQIAELQSREVNFLRRELVLTSDINQMGWIEQAKILSAGGMTAFAASLLGGSSAEEVVEEPAVVQDVAPVEAVEEAPQSVVEPEAVAEPEPEPVFAPVAEPDIEPEGDAIDEGAAPVDDAERLVSRARDNDEGRLLSREARSKREEERRLRYGGERRGIPPVQGADSTAGDIQEAENAAVFEAADDTVEEATATFVDETPIVDAPVAEESIQDAGVDEAVQPVDSDDLKQIKYISTGLEKKLNLLGVYKLSQIANWGERDIADISEQLELKDRIQEEGWIAQAAQAMESGEAAESSGGFFGGLVARLAELDQIEDLNEHEKTMLSKHGVTSLSQIANWSGADQKWAKELLQLDSFERVGGWVAVAQGLLASGDGAVPGGTPPASEDDLKRIRGIDPETEATLKEIGVTSYEQIAAWEQEDINRINDVLGIAGRVERQYWVVQAKVLRDGGTTDYSKLYDGTKEQG